MKQQEIETRNTNRLPLFFLVTVLYWFSTYTYVPVFTSYLKDLGASDSFAGIVVGSYGFVQMLLRIPVGLVSDRYNKKRLFIIFGLTFSLLSSVGFALSRDLNVILICRSLAGATAATWVDFTVLFSSYFKKNEAKKAISTLSVYNYLGQMTGMLLGSVAAQLTFRGPFILGAVASGFAIVLAFFLVEKKQEGSDQISIKTFAVTVRDKTLLSVSFLAILSQVMTFATANGFTPLFAKQMGSGNMELGILNVMGALPTALGALFLTKFFLGRYTERQLVSTGNLLMAVTAILTPFMPNFGFLLANQFLAGIGRGMSFTLLMGLAIADVDQSKRGTAMGIFQAIYGLGMFAGPALTGFLSDAMNLNSAFYVIGAIGFVTTGLSMLMIGSKKKA